VKRNRVFRALLSLGSIKSALLIKSALHWLTFILGCHKRRSPASLAAIATGNTPLFRVWNIGIEIYRPRRNVIRLVPGL
jgi:hypothetical protein